MDDRLTALLCVYQEADQIEACIDSLGGHVDRLLVADGRYAMFPGDAWGSTDNTVPIVNGAARHRGLPVEWVQQSRWETEHAKRTALVAHESHDVGDMLLVIDADERLEVRGGFDLRALYGDYRLEVRGVDGCPGRQDAVRLFAYRPGMVYRWHFGLYTVSQRAVLSSTFEQVRASDCRITHHHHLRDPGRVAADKTYESLLVPAERALGAYGGR